VIVVSGYRGHRIEVNAVAADGGYNAEVRILRLPRQAARRDGDLFQADGRSRGAERRDLGEAVDRSECQGGRVMATDDRITPTTGQLTMTGEQAAVFRRHYEQRRRGYMTAATSMLYGTPAVLVLPYHYDVLTSARDFLDAGMDDIAVIMAQTACEIATADIITGLLQHHRLPASIESWINATIERISTLKTETLYDLYRALSGDDLKQTQKVLWESYVRRTALRNDIVHKGGHASKAQATEACDTALDLIQHFAVVRSRATAPR
jgi:hypothetical protein